MSSQRPRLPKEFVAGHKCHRMMTAVAELSAERGYEATKIADIVRRAGVGRKTLYDNFDGKEDLFLAALAAALSEVEERVEAACAAADGPWQNRVEAGLAALLGFVAEHPAQARLCMVEALSATPASARRHDAALRYFVALLKRSTPAETGLPDTTEETLVGGVAWILNEKIRRGTAVEAEKLLSELVEFILSPYNGVAELNRYRKADVTVRWQTHR